MSTINGFSMRLRGETLVPRYLETIINPVPNEQGYEADYACSNWGYQKFQHGERLQALWP